MNEDIRRLQRILEQATSAEDPSDENLDPQTASLREGWVAFGRLLEANQSRVGQAQRSPTSGGHAVLWGGASRTHPTSRRWRVPAIAAMAASLLICAVTIWIFNSVSQSEVSSLPAKPMASASDKDNTLGQQNLVAALPATDELQWDDSFDQQVAQLDRQMSYAQSGPHAMDDATALLQYGIEQMQADFSENKL